MKVRVIISIALLSCFVLMAVGCRGRGGTALTDAEAGAVAAICGLDAASFVDISRDVLTKERASRFPAVDKVYRNGDFYAFVVSPVAYNGPVTLAIVIDGETGRSVGLRIVKHAETPHYVRDMESPWFIERFAGKTALEYLGLVRLTARSDSDIVAITGATVTTEGIINGVNAAFGVYQEFVYDMVADDVPYMVRFEPGHGDGPVETGNLSIRAYGVVLAEVPLDEIRALPSVRRSMDIHSSAGVTRHSFRGTLLSNVLDLVDPGLMGEYDRAFAIGVDDYISGVGMDEILAENSVFIMYEDNGEPLTKKNGEPGAMRIVVINDVFGQRFTNYLLEVVLENEAP